MVRQPDGSRALRPGGRRRDPGGVPSAGADAAFRRLPAGGRPGRNAQLRGDHLRRELLGQREPVRQGQVPGRHPRFPERRRRHRDHAQVGLRHQALRRGPPGAAASAGRLRQASQCRRLHPDRPGLRGEPGGGDGGAPAHGRAGSSRAQAVPGQHPGGRRYPQDGGAGGGGSRQAAADRQRRAPHEAAGLSSAPTAAARTATAA